MLVYIHLRNSFYLNGQLGVLTLQQLAGIVSESMRLLQQQKSNRFTSYDTRGIDHRHSARCSVDLVGNLSALRNVDHCHIPPKPSSEAIECMSTINRQPDALLGAIIVVWPIIVTTQDASVKRGKARGILDVVSVLLEVAAVETAAGKIYPS